MNAMTNSHIATENSFQSIPKQSTMFESKGMPLTLNRTIILTLDSAHLGGIETHVLTLAKHLHNRGYQVQVWFMREYQTNPLYKLLEQQQITYQFCTTTKQYWQKLKQAKEQIVLHTHGYKAGIVARIAAKLYGIPILSTFHSGDLGRGKLRVYSQIDLWTAHFAKSIAVSNIIKGWLPQSAQLIPNFVEVPEPTVSRPSKGSNKTLQVAFVGRLSHEKGPDTFCELARLFEQQQEQLATKDKQNEQPVEFVLYGDGPDRTELIDQYHPHVQFKGHVKMQEYWQHVDALCISSRFEGLPYVALEAMSLGIPVITFDVGGLKNLIDSKALGWVVEAGNIQALKHAIEQWYQLNGQQREAQSLLLKEKIHQHYSTDALIPKIEQLYLDVING